MSTRTLHAFTAIACAAALACAGASPAASPPAAGPAASTDGKPGTAPTKPAVPATPVAKPEPTTAPEKPATPEPATPPTDKRLVGHWTYSGGAEPKFAFNARGRVQMSLGATKCVGNYAIKDDKVGVKYDAGQKGCSDFGPPAAFNLKDKDATLGFAGAAYKRDDAKDDGSF